MKNKPEGYRVEVKKSLRRCYDNPGGMWISTGVGEEFSLEVKDRLTEEVTREIIQRLE